MPYLVLRRNFKAIENLQKYALGDNNWKQLLVDSFVLIASFTLPVYVEHMLSGSCLDPSLDVVEQLTNCITLEVRFIEIFLVLFVKSTKIGHGFSIKKLKQLKPMGSLSIKTIL